MFTCLYRLNSVLSLDKNLVYLLFEFITLKDE